MKTSKIAIIMINIGNYEYYREFNDLKNREKVDWFYFTDNKELESNFWNIINITNLSELKYYDNRLKVKFIKIQTHKILPNYEYYFYIDAAFPINNKNFINDLLELVNEDLVFYIHNSNKKTRNIKGEVDRCKKLKSVNKEKLNLQLKTYLDDNYPDIKGKLFCGGIFLRRNTIEINNMMELWFQHNEIYTTRDQISLPYVMWKMNVYPTKVIHENININSLVGKKRKKSRKI